MGFELYSYRYLNDGSIRQKQIFTALNESQVYERLLNWYSEQLPDMGPPALVGSFALDLSIAGSDIDIACEVIDFKQALQRDRDLFGTLPEFTSERFIAMGVGSVVSRFKVAGEYFEIFSQKQPVPLQNSVRHLLVEERLLLIGGIDLRNRVTELKNASLSTEAAFAKALGFSADKDPYYELLTLEEKPDSELFKLIEISKRNQNSD